MGPSGSGKSTLMHLLGALDSPTSGQVLFQGRALEKMADRELSHLRRSKIGFIFQFFNLLPTLKAVENVALPLLLGGMGRTAALKPAYEGLERVGLHERAEHFPDEMSGGEMQRVAIARALMSRPRVLFADEPTGNLDEEKGEEIVGLLRDLNRDDGLTMIMVTHNRDLVAPTDRVVRLVKGRVEGAVLEPLQIED